MSQVDLPCVLAAGEALEEWNFGGDVLRLLVSAERSRGAVSVIEFVGHGGGPPVHVHDDEDEVVLVLEGRLAYRIGDLEGEVEQGGVLWMPRQIPHAVANLSPNVCRFVGAAIPGGIEVLFRAQSRYLSSLPEGHGSRPGGHGQISRGPKRAASSHCGARPYRGGFEGDRRGGVSSFTP